MTVVDLGEARRRREEANHRRDEHRATIAAVADWVLHNLPVALPFRHSADFLARWPGMTRNELDEIAAEIDRRIGLVMQSISKLHDLDAAAQGLSGRYEKWSRAANWLIRHFPERDVTDPDFIRYFGDITGAELALAAIERQRRIAASLGIVGSGQ